jgi:hypothetical protein
MARFGGPFLLERPRMATTVENPFDTQQPNATNQNPSQQTSSAGIVASNLPQPNTAMTYTPETRQVNQATDTVQGQVNSILSKDSPLMQRARTMATQQMAQRGLVNSSMAVGAGTAAMIDRATPIAAQDANTYNTVASENMGAKNRAAEFGAGQLNQFSLQKGQQEFVAGQAELDRSQQTNLQANQQQFQAGQASLDRSQQTNLQTAQQNFQSAQSALDRALSTAQQDKSLAAQQALQQAQQNFQGAQADLDRAQQTNIAGMNISAQQALQQSQQNFQGTQAGLDRAQQTSLQMSQQQFQSSQQAIQNDFNMRLQQLQESGQDFRQARDIASREAMQKLSEMGIDNRFDQELALKDKMFNIEQYNLDKRQLIANQNELDKLGLQIKASQAQIPTTFAANISNTAMNGVNAIMADGNLTADAKKAAVANIVNYANAQISWAEKFYGTTVPPITTPI